jgi:hypothetical protein
MSLCVLLQAAPLVAAGAVIGMKVAPPVRVSNLPIAGAQTTARLDPTTDVTQIKAGIAYLTLPRSIRLGSKQFGADITVDPSYLSLTDRKGNFDTTTIERLIERFSDVRPQLSELQVAVRTHYERWAAGGAATVLLSGDLLLAWWLVSKRRLARMTDAERTAVLKDRRWKQPARRAVLTTATLGIVVYATGTYFSPTTHRPVLADPILSGTPLEGGELGGPAKFAFDTVLPNAISVVTATNAFYRAGSQHFTDAFTDLYRARQLPRQEHVRRFVVFDDVQGVSGMQRIIGVAAKAFNADSIFNSGDTSFSGTRWETASVSTLPYYAGKITTWAAEGAHDSSDIATMQRNKGMVVADGKTRTVAGISALGVNDPYRAPFAGQSRHLTDPVLAREVLDTGRDAAALTADRATAEACQTHPLVIFVHDHAIGDPLAQSGCATFVFTGREFVMPPPRTYASPGGGRTYEVINGSAGGHGNGDGPEIGIIHNPATFTVVEYDESSGMATYTVVTVRPDTSVQIAAAQQFPQAIEGTAVTQPETSTTHRRQATPALSAGH